MTQQPNNFKVKILERVYSLKCDPADLPNLQKAADHLNQKLQEIRTSYKTLSREEIAMMAALNSSYEMFNQKQDGFQQDEIQQTADALSKKIEDFLTQN